MHLSQDVCFIEQYLLDYDVACIFFPFYIIRNRIKETAEQRGIPTFVVADAGRTQVCFYVYGSSYVNIRVLFSFCAGVSLGIEVK
jgi:hypothetical protein